MTSDDFPWWYASPVEETAVCGKCGAIVPDDWQGEHAAFHRAIDADEGAREG